MVGTWSLGSTPPIGHEADATTRWVLASDGAAQMSGPGRRCVLAGAVVCEQGGWYVWRQHWLRQSTRVVQVAEMMSVAQALRLARPAPSALVLVDATAILAPLDNWLSSRVRPRWWPGWIDEPPASYSAQPREVRWVKRSHDLIRVADRLATLALGHEGLPDPELVDRVLRADG